MIDNIHKLPCDFIITRPDGSIAMRFGQGVALETVRQAAERWFNYAGGGLPPKSKDPTDVRYLIDKAPSR